MSRESQARQVGLPIRPFLYTPAQVADFLGMTEQGLKLGYLYLHGVHSGIPPLDKLQTRNIAPQGKAKEWRIAEKELIRWLRRLGFKIVDGAYVQN